MNPAGSQFSYVVWPGGYAQVPQGGKLTLAARLPPAKKNVVFLTLLRHPKPRTFL